METGKLFILVLTVLPAVYYAITALQALLQMMKEGTFKTTVPAYVALAAIVVIFLTPFVLWDEIQQSIDLDQQIEKFMNSSNDLRR